MKKRRSRHPTKKRELTRAELQSVLGSNDLTTGNHTANATTVSLDSGDWHGDIN